ncbi:MAG TPA: integrase core domain-containing protein, partial [Anaerolineae bacterium]|nr:integrase core domain-containing protein [Anaerolineae bacterium]
LSRRVIHFGVTRHPTQQSVAQQLREATPDGVQPKFIVRDNDRKFGTAFDHAAESSGIKVLQIPDRAPRANALCERFLGSVRRECLDYFLILSERQLFHVVREYVSYFNRARPDQGLQQQIPEKIENENVERPAPNEINLFLGLKEIDSERRRSTAPEAEANRSEARGKIIVIPVLNGLHHDYRRVA